MFLFGKGSIYFETKLYLAQNISVIAGKDCYFAPDKRMEILYEPVKIGDFDYGGKNQR